jgi:hypothetical protein
MRVDLGVCASGCRHFVSSRAASRRGGQPAAPVNEPGVNLTEPVEIMIPCRKSAGRSSDAIENSLGFYLGVRLPRTSGMRVHEATSRLLFDKATECLLGVATDEDLRRRNAALRQALRIAKDVSDRTPSSLQIPLCLLQSLATLGAHDPSAGT